jgi:hypothetical protein
MEVAVMADSGYKNISRIDSEKKNMHGWYVRIFHNNKSYAKYFNDNKSGGRTEALQDAVEYRNQLEIELGKPRTERYFFNSVHPKNNTGVPGVNRRIAKQKKRGKWYSWDVYEVNWTPQPNKLARTTVSIKKYGEEEAFRRACAIREQKMAELYRTSRAPEQIYQHIKWIKYNGEDILTVDYHNVALSNMPSITDAVTTIVNKWPEKVRLLYKIEDVDIGNEIIEHLNRAGREVLPNAKKIAIAGVSGFRAQLFRAVSLFSRSNFTLFADEQKALDWLVR